MFRVAAFAELAGVSSKTLRDYDARGLFRPAFVDRQTGYRMYSPAQLPELRRILALRDLGVGRADIDRLVRERADLREVLERRREALERERRDLDRRLAAVGIELELAGAGSVGADVVVRELRPELVATLDTAEVPRGAIDRAFYLLEVAVRDAGVRAARPPGALVDESGGGGRSLEVFVPIRRQAGDAFAWRSLPGGRAATVIHRGEYDTLRETWQGLRRWVTAAGLSPAGPTRVLYLRFGAERELELPERFLARSDADFVTEIQIPVT